MNSQYEHNPYHAPTAELDEYYEDFEYDDTPFYKPSGRIGCIRYLAYGFLINLCLGLFMVPVGIVAAVLAQISTDLAMVVFGIGHVVLIIASMYGMFAPAIRRLNDLNQTGWLSLLYMVPVVNFCLWLYLVFARGSEEPNDYGAPAEPPTTAMYILALLVPIFFLVGLGILAAIAIPAYQQYVMSTSMGL